MKKKILTALLLFSAMLTGCADTAPESDVEGAFLDTSKKDTPATEVNTSAILKDNETGKAEEAVFNLGQAILDANHSDGNIMVSPVSIERALAMAMEGASGTTKEEIFKALYGSLSEDSVSGLSSLYETNGSEDSFLIANSIWTNSDNSVTLNPEYEELVSSKYKASATSLPFSDPTTVDKINSFVAEKTNNQIPSILQGLNEDDSIVIVNTTYFKGGWINEFILGPQDYEFTNADGSITKTPALLSLGSDRFLRIKGYDAFRKDYDNGFYYVAILPEESKSPIDVMKDVSYSDIVEATPEFVTLNVTFPSYESDYSVVLNDTLKVLGINEAFSDSAAFDLMSSVSTKISEVVHKTHIKLDEKGTEASAATAMINATTTGMMDKEVVDLVFDRPFVYYIFNHNNVPVFMGIVNTLQ